MPTVETPYAEAKASKLYLPPIEEGVGVIRDYYDGEIHFPAGLIGSQKVRYAPSVDDGEKAWAYKRKLTPPPSMPIGTRLERETNSFGNTNIPIGNPVIPLFAEDEKNTVPVGIKGGSQ